MKIINWVVGLFKRKKKVANNDATTEHPSVDVVKEVLDNGKFKVGDKVKITSSERGRKRRSCNYLYEGKVGELLHIWDLERNPWGNYVVIMPEGFNDCFYEEELEVVEES